MDLSELPIIGNIFLIIREKIQSEIKGYIEHNYYLSSKNNIVTSFSCSYYSDGSTVLIRKGLNPILIIRDNTTKEHFERIYSTVLMYINLEVIK